MYAVIIAGGQGTRLAEIAKDIPKAMVEVGGKPLILHHIELLKENGINEIIVLSGYLSEKLEEFLGNGKKWGTKITIIKEDVPLGTAGAIKQIEAKINEDFIVLFGDVMMAFNIKKFIEWHNEREDAVASIIIHPNNHPFDSNLIKIDDDGKIIGLFLKPHPENAVLPNLSIAGAYIFSNKIFKYIPENKKNDFEKDVLPIILKSEEKIYGYNTPEYLKDMGTTKRLEEVRNEYQKGLIKYVR